MFKNDLKKFIEIWRRIFSDRVTRIAGVIFLAITAVVTFNIVSHLPSENPVFGTIFFTAVPILFVAGGIVFLMAILKGTAFVRARLLFLMFAGAAGIALLVVGSYQLVEFTDTTGFCGRLCHTVMYPEYTVYQASPHSRVLCTSCHVGPGAGYLVKSKLAGVPLIFSTVFSNYERPITTPVRSLRPARDTCEACHRPERFTGDFVVQHTTYSADEKNTSAVDTRIFRVGGGQASTATGIHWHIATNVYYAATDQARQEINWVSVQTADGEVVYSAPGSNNTTTPAQDNKRLMDCVDCHNRATHQFLSPEALLDNAFAERQLDISLPYLKKQAMLALDPANTSLEAAYAKIEAIREYYKTNYPDIFNQKQASINSSIETIKSVAVLTTFPYMRVDWKTYVNNIGHQSSPGCFRCHGKLVAQNGPQKGQSISNDCTACHYLSVGGLQK